ncbi:MAG: 2-oxoacid:acceptor oxidoreductase family protein [Candidatus Adiutrix sp.]|jgi:2-oxoacid:acceptor oxidoreductase gamma subunit (pyruvate/2-ketoisovalerate family)|nr:2-oxoacid:acceptor oxidoreductase family protein [Candidatus Adiutrix sp.]
MKEIRMHGRGGQGVVKSAQVIVQTVVGDHKYAHFIPFFGVERKGSPVYGFLRLDDQDIRLKCQVYEPDILMIFDDTLLSLPQTFDGFKAGGTIILNTCVNRQAVKLPTTARRVALVDATGLALSRLGRNIPNTAMLGAFAKVCDQVNWESLKKQIAASFGEKNVEAAQAAYEAVAVS